MAVDFALSSDQQMVSDVFAGFFANECPTSVVRAAEPLGFSPELWQQLIQMEAPSMAAPAEVGGSGASMGDLVAVAEQLGAAAAPVPLLDHWAASTVFADQELVTGGAIAALALTGADDSGRWRLVPAGAVADVVIGVDRDETVVVRAEAPMAAPDNHAAAPVADRSAISGDRVVVGGAEIHEVARARWQVLTASALVGVAARSLQIGIEYVLEREQFGRPIGSFQAVQHGLADLPAMIDGARFLTHKAAWAFDEGRVGTSGVIDLDNGILEEAHALASMAILQAGDAAALASDRSLHYHGGYGFSLEYDIQLYYRRARGWARVAGDPAHERRRLADLVFGEHG